MAKSSGIGRPIELPGAFARLHGRLLLLVVVEAGRPQKAHRLDLVLVRNGGVG